MQNKFVSPKITSSLGVWSLLCDHFIEGQWDSHYTDKTTFAGLGIIVA